MLKDSLEDVNAEELALELLVRAHLTNGLDFVDLDTLTELATEITRNIMFRTRDKEKQQ